MAFAVRASWGKRRQFRFLAVLSLINASVRDQQPEEETSGSLPEAVRRTWGQRRGCFPREHRAEKLEPFAGRCGNFTAVPALLPPKPKER